MRMIITLDILVAALVHSSGVYGRNVCARGTHSCHYLATCNYLEGTFQCSCKPGSTGDGQNCTDINECSTGTHKCHADGRCVNVLLSYRCFCKSGFTGNGSYCEDINECNTEVHECDINAQCTNLQGSYKCICKVGYSGNGFVCKDLTATTTMSPTTTTESQTSSSGTPMVTTEKKHTDQIDPKEGIKTLENRLKTFQPGNMDYLKTFVKTCSLVMKSIKKKESKPATPFTPQPQPSGFEVLTQLNKLGNMLADDMRKRKSNKVSVAAENIALGVSLVNTKRFDGYTFSEQAKEVLNSISLSGVFNPKDKDNATIISIVYDPVKEMIARSNSSSFGSAFINSKIFSTTVDPAPMSDIKVELVLKNLQSSNSTEPKCVFWQYDSGGIEHGKWSDKGCFMLKSNSTHTMCHCNHLTNFAVLFRTSESKSEKVDAHKKALTIISLIGCLISAFCCGMTVIVLCVFRNLLRSQRNIIHMNLALSLLFANVIFLISGQVTGHKGLCISASIGLFYFFLAAFCWMLSEGIYIWIVVVKVFANNLKTWYYLAFGWGMPLLVVVIASAILRENIVASNFCWLSTSGGAIWAFVAPALIVVLVNFIVLVKALCVAVEHPTTDEKAQKIKVSARLTVVLVPVLGLTWIFGIFTMNLDTVVFEYLFTVFNSLQGLFIFIFYILCNSEVKKEYKKWYHRREDISSLPLKPTSSAVRRSDSRTRSTHQEDLEVAAHEPNENQNMI